MASVEAPTKTSGSKTKVDLVDPAEPGPVLESEHKFISRETFLAAAGNLAEEELFVEGVGRLLLSEVRGDARADIVAKSMEAFRQDRIDVKGYQRAVLLAGVVDPQTPPEDRQPLFKAADMDQVMRIGGSKILAAVDVIERLSLMGRYQPSAEGFSETTLSSEPTSG